MYPEARIAAMALSPAAVITCIPPQVQSPAAKTPSTLVFCWWSTVKQPFLSVVTPAFFTIAVKGTPPKETKTPLTSLSPSSWVPKSSIFIALTICSPTILVILPFTIYMLGLFRSLSVSVPEISNSGSLVTNITLFAMSDRNKASIAASSPLPTTATFTCLKKGPSQVTQ